MYSSINTLWVLLGTVLVFFMQAGFAMLESGFTRFKNSGNIAMKNLMDFCIGSLAFVLIGFSLMYGGDFSGLIGLPGVFSAARSDISPYAFLMFSTVFCATSATIVSGAMAERTKFASYLICSLIISAVIYPVSGHWIWNPEGWLYRLGFHDFSGSTAVHLTGGLSALFGAAIVGPRLGKYSGDGSSRAIPGHSLTISSLGIFILWMGWFGFNSVSSLSITGDDAILTVSRCFLVTSLSAASASVAAMFISWVRYGKPDISMTLNGVLAGLVAITAGCDVMAPWAAVLTGACAGFLVVLSIEFIDLKLKIDDPVGAVSAHGVCGALGTVMVGLFSQNGGVFTGGSLRLLGVQCLGVAAVSIWVTAAAFSMFFLLKNTIGLRVSKDAEADGLDIWEHGLAAGNKNDLFPTVLSDFSSGTPVEVDISDGRSLSEIDPSLAKADGKIRRVVILMKQNRFEALKNALDSIDITGITVTSVCGCGTQKGHTEYYRGARLDMMLLPKLKVEIVISTVPMDLLVSVVKKVLYTGRIGDGKIFIYPVENVIRVRTGEEGARALE